MTTQQLIEHPRLINVLGNYAQKHKISLEQAHKVFQKFVTQEAYRLFGDKAKIRFATLKSPLARSGALDETYRVFFKLEIVETVTDRLTQISVEDAKEALGGKVELGQSLSRFVKMPLPDLPGFQNTKPLHVQIADISLTRAEAQDTLEDSKNT